ncbi:hypothetical protein [Lysobacter enzymogenes]|uniref:hypothetical protein n=1 Tax=Lysobacter enzymogenes TaxID=69 RepID=UPI00099D8A32|nr:hypothetical protein [Lysobacter enzymogenes]UZW62454.1 hypothetical protein BV903_009245 [Lysobacter enzymogenes]
MNMHDWVLLKIEIEWSKGELVIGLVDAGSTPVEIKASGMRAFHLERGHAWGESSSLYEAIGPVEVDAGFSRMSLMMQSGDALIVEAKSFLLPANIVR